MINSIDDIKKFINKKNYNKVFILFGKRSFLLSGAENFFKENFYDKKIKFFAKNSDLPILEELIEINNQIRDFKPNLLLAVGGGTVIDYAKAANTIDTSTNLADLIVNYSYPFKEKYTKLLVIPTTAGSGAEVTPSAVIYVNNVKYSLESKLLIPDYFLLIPEFLVSAPNAVKASAGFDTISQALESLISIKSNYESISYASRSLKISTRKFLPFLKNSNLKNAGDMSVAANLAGKAISISKTTAPHAISYPFTSLFKISHGHAVSLFFEKIFLFNYANLNKSETDFDLNKRFSLIFDIFKVKNIDDFIMKISMIKKNAGLEDDLVKLNIDIKKNAKKIIGGINLLRLKNNPVKINNNDVYKILTKN